MGARRMLTGGTLSLPRALCEYVHSRRVLRVLTDGTASKERGTPSTHRGWLEHSQRPHCATSRAFSAVSAASAATSRAFAAVRSALCAARAAVAAAHLYSAAVSSP
jgi:hypothetical protein